MILRYIGKGLLWFILLWMLAYVLAAAALPTWLTYQHVGWRWAVVVGIATVGMLWFARRFGPYLIARWIARAMAADIKAQTEAMAHEINIGLWNPNKRDSVISHAAAEGISLSPKRALGETNE